LGYRSGDLSARRLLAESAPVLDDRSDGDPGRPCDEPDVRRLSLDPDLSRPGLAADLHVSWESDDGTGAVPNDADHHPAQRLRGLVRVDLAREIRLGLTDDSVVWIEDLRYQVW